MQPTSAKALLKDLYPAAPAGLSITDVVTDSRQVVPGCIFVAIAGERVDGHRFAAQALEAGAALVVGSHEMDGVPADRAVLVDDVLAALITMGANYRALFSPLLLAVTGSVGKTTTKEFCAAVFSAFGDTVKTEGNQNNEIGMPKTLFRLTEETRYAVVEMGMQGLGEIRQLAQAARPAGAVITRIGQAHLQQLGSVENVLAAKMEVAEGVAMGGPLILNGDDEWLRGATRPQGLQVVLAGLDNEDCDVRAANLRREAHGVVFDIIDKQYGGYEAFIPALGRHNVQDALLAYTAATRLGLNSQQTAAALAGYVPAGQRQTITQARGVTVIEDFYNAGPDSMRAALDTLGELEGSGRRIAVLGDMLELGVVSEDAHRALGEQVQKNGVELLITVGELAALAADEAERRGIAARRCKTNDEAAAALEKAAQKGDMVLLKASRGMRFEEILQAFLA